MSENIVDDQVVESYVTGRSRAWISSKFGVPDYRVKEILARRGVQLRKRGQTVFTRFDEAEVAKNYKDGSSISAIAASLGVPMNSVRSSLVRQGVEIRKHPQYITLTEDQKVEIISLYKSGMAVRKISFKFGISDHSTRGILIDLGVDVSRRYPNRVCSRCESAEVHSYGKCEPCLKLYRREYHLLNKYGVSLSDYDRLLQAQGGSCAICRGDDPGHKSGVFQVDHCHETGNVRGLLCFHCNKALGYFGDTIDGVQRAVRYLENA